MKISIFLIIACCAVALCQEPNKDILKIGTDCAKENGVTDKEYMDYHAGKIKGADVKENLKCTNKCFLIKNGFMDESGKFMPEVFKTKMAGMDPKVLTEGLEKCKGKEAANICEKAYLISDCFLQIKLQG